MMSNAITQAAFLDHMNVCKTNYILVSWRLHGGGDSCCESATCRRWEAQAGHEK